ncbi:MAG TPA: class I SAM-dependent methyltransferase [Gaiellaceae bacterium]|nr:class I SAM-dependent methyltransferase [Gaiellaceae bacterium]
MAPGRERLVWRLAREFGAASVVGIESSEKMLERARGRTSDAEIDRLRSFA